MTDAAGLNYQRLLREVADQALQAGRDPAEVEIVAVSKNHPWNDVTSAYEAGCRNFGENRLQEALEKIEEAPRDIRWHLIGTLQKNKVRKAVGPFSLIHSVDSLELAQKIAEVSQELRVTTSILLQVNTSGEESKHGFTPEYIRKHFYDLYILTGIRIEGLMTMAPWLAKEKTIRACFSDLRYLAKELGLRHLSMGMSQDWPIAVQEGATLLRLGTTLFGERE